MTNLKEPAPHYTAQEIVEIITAAKSQGVTFLKIEGFEAAWDLPRAAAPKTEAVPVAPPADPPPSASATRTGVFSVGPRHQRSDRPPACRECGAEMRASKWRGQFYCIECYRAAKERQERNGR
jgi:hypothetical protein